MALTRQNIRDIIYTSLRLWDQRDADGHTTVAPAFVDEQINLAQVDVRLQLRDVIENWNTTLVADQRSYDLPDDYLLYDEVWVKRDTTTNYQGERLKPVSYNRLVPTTSRFDTTPDSATPERFAISTDHVLYLDPVPSSAIRIDLFYLPYPSEMTSDSDVPDFKDIFHDVVRARAEYKVASVTGRDARPAYASYQELLKQYAPFASSRRNKIVQLSATRQVPWSEF